MFIAQELEYDRERREFMTTVNPDDLDGPIMIANPKTNNIAVFEVDEERMRRNAWFDGEGVIYYNSKWGVHFMIWYDMTGEFV